MNRNSFIFYREWAEAIKGLPNDTRLSIYECAIEYATTGSVGELTAIAAVAFNFIKTAIDKDTAKYVSIIERNKDNGKRGGRPRKPKKPSGFFENPKNPEKPKKADNDNDNDNDNTLPTSPNGDVSPSHTETVPPYTAEITPPPTAGAAPPPLSGREYKDAPAKSDEDILFENFQKWLDKNAPNVQRLKEPFTKEQYLRLRKEFDKDTLTNTILQMHNWKPLTRNNTSANLTFRKWVAKDRG